VGAVVVFEAAVADGAKRAMLNPATRSNPQELQDQAVEVLAPELRNFSIVREGPLYRLARVAVLSRDGARLARLGVILGLVCWVPLAVLSALQGVLTSGATVPFYGSLGTHARFLVAVPLFFVAEVWFDVRSGEVLRELVRSRIIPVAETSHFVKVARRAIALVDSWVVEAALIVLAGVLLVSQVRWDLPVAVPTWRNPSGAPGGLTWAGWWYTLVSMPIFQFLVWRWCWRLLVWWWILWRISRMNLHLVPTHPDRAAGLGGLGVTHVNLSPLIFGLSAMLVASYAETVLFGGAKLEGLVIPLVLIVVESAVLVLAPLTLFAPKLFSVKQHGLMKYGQLASAYTQAFEAKWIKGGAANEELLGTADLQSLADLGNSFEVVENMRIVPFSKDHALLLALAAALPMLPLLLIVLPLNELIVRGVKSVFDL
jgi:hypothetical protein